MTKFGFVVLLCVGIYCQSTYKYFDNVCVSYSIYHTEMNEFVKADQDDLVSLFSNVLPNLKLNKVWFVLGWL